jgi:hypothetical protein
METFSRGTSLDPWYVTGFADGEASFTYSRSGKQMGLYFGIKLTARDRPLLDRIRDFFGFGFIYDVKPVAATARSGWTKSSAYYRVTRNADLLRIVAHFDSYPLQGNKAATYAIWRQMVELKSAFRKPDREQLTALALQLSALNARSLPWE